MTAPTERSDVERRLSTRQRDLLDSWLGTYRIVRDHSWPGLRTVVAHTRSEAGDLIVKASAGEVQEHHIAREIAAHRSFLAGLGDGLPELVAADSPARLIVTRYLPGRLAEGSRWESDPEVHRRAGALLARVHAAAPPVPSDTYQPAALGKLHRLVERGRTLEASVDWDEVAARLHRFVACPVDLVPTHGDFQPRNWLVDESRPDSDGVPDTSLIDFGRAELRPWYSDLVRLHHQGFVDHPELVDAVATGLGRTSDGGTGTCTGDERPGWELENLLQAVGTVVWATDVDDAAFARQGIRMVERTLADGT